MKYGNGTAAGSAAVVATTIHNHSSASSATGKLHVSTPSLSVYLTHSSSHSSFCYYSFLFIYLLNTPGTTGISQQPVLLYRV